MITVAQCSNVDEAMLLKSLLQGSGITAFVPDEFTAQNAPPYLFAGTGIRLQVAEADAEQANALLAAAGHDGLAGEADAGL